MGRASGLKADGYCIGRCKVCLLVGVCDLRLSDAVFGFSDPEAPWALRRRASWNCLSLIWEIRQCKEEKPLGG